MKETSLNEVAEAMKMMEQGTAVSVEIISYLESRGIPLKVAVISCGIAFSSGAGTLGVTRESAIDLFDVFFTRNGINHEAH